MKNGADENPLMMKTFRFVKKVSSLYYVKFFFVIKIFHYMPNMFLLLLIFALIFVPRWALGQKERCL